MDTPKELNEVKEAPKPAIPAGIEETKDVVIFLASLANAIKKSLDDGEVTWTDAMNFVGLVTKVFPAITGIGQVPIELDDLEDDEKEILIALVKDELDFSDNVEEIIEECFLIADDIRNLIEKF